MNEYMNEDLLKLKKNVFGACNSVGKSIRLISVKSGVQVPSCPHLDNFFCIKRKKAFILLFSKLT